MSRALVTSSRYSPGNLPGETLQRLFVARGTLLDDARRRVESALKKGSQQFVLFVGPRGAGKTHLLALLRHHVDHDPRFAASRARICVAPLNEEEWGIASYLDLLVRILQAIAARESDARFNEEIQGIYRAFGQSPDAVIQMAEQLLTRRVGDRMLLLLCENLDQILDGLGEEGQKRWRAFIQQRRYWNIVATSPALSAALQDQSFPFYNFFTVRHLDRLTLEQATELIQRKAEVDEKVGLAALLDSPMGRARMRAIHHLAGGNSRVYVILADFLDQESLDVLWPTFLRTIDDLTPYYQDRIRQLAPAQRKIVECLSLAGHPIVVKEIAARCLMTPQTAAKQLSELARLRYVLREQHGRESWYELAEPLMRICIDVKGNRTRHLRTFVELMRRWYSADEPGPEHARTAPADRGAFARQVSALQSLGRYEEALLLVDQRIAQLPNDARTHDRRADVLLRLGRAKEALQSAVRAIELGPTNHFAWTSKALCLLHLKRLREAEAATLEALRFHTFAAIVTSLASDLLRRGAPDAALRVVDALDARDGAYDETTLLRVRALFELDRFDEAWTALTVRDRTAAQRPDWYADLVAMEAAAVSPDAALRRLDKLMKKATSEQGSELVAKLLISLARARGPIALASALPKLRAALSSHDQAALLIGGVVALVHDLSGHRPRITAEWDLALPQIMQTLADIEGAELSLQMLSVLVRHVRTGDATVLLELPLEARQLLTDKVETSREA